MIHQIHGHPSNRLHEAALAYASKLNLPVFPCKARGKEPITRNGHKDATTDSDQIKRWWSKTPHANIGIPTGKRSGFDVLDIDPRNGGDDSLVQLERRYGKLPSTPIALTGGGGHHVFFASDDRIRNAVNGLPGVDTRGEGGYVITPPSVHATGRLYEWHPEARMTDVQLALWPPGLLEWLIERLGPGSEMETRTDPILEGRRNNTLTSIGGQFRRSGLDEHAMVEQLLQINHARCQPPLRADEVRGIAHSVARYTPSQKAATIHTKSATEETATGGIDLDALRCMADVVAEEVDWFWQDRIPNGEVTGLDGNPEVGKSYLTHSLAADLSNGTPLPGQAAMPPANTLLLTAEDSVGHTLRPRLDRLGADGSRIYAYEGPIQLDAEGRDNLDTLIKRTSAVLVVIDPITAFLPARMDINRANEVRSVLAPLNSLAERHKCAIVIIRHLTKSQASKAIYRGLGSIDFAAACRSLLLAGNDPDNENVRAVVQIKNNLGPKAEAIGYSIDKAGNYRWTGVSTLTAQRILAGERDETALSAAQEYLIRELHGGRKSATEVKAAAIKAGHAEITVNRAKKELGIYAEKDGFQGLNYWHLPGEKDSDDQDTDMIRTGGGQARTSDDDQD